jgi:hypothetical protein
MSPAAGGGALPDFADPAGLAGDLADFAIAAPIRYATG